MFGGFSVGATKIRSMKSCKVVFILDELNYILMRAETVVDAFKMSASTCPSIRYGPARLFTLARRYGSNSLHRQQCVTDSGE